MSTQTTTKPGALSGVRVIDMSRVFAAPVGAQILAMTDSNASPLALAADATILFAVSSPSFFPSTAAGLAVAEALLEVLVVEAGEDAAERIERAEQQLLDSGAYLRTRRKRITAGS